MRIPSLQKIDKQAKAEAERRWIAEKPKYAHLHDSYEEARKIYELIQEKWDQVTANCPADCTGNHACTCKAQPIYNLYLESNRYVHNRWQALESARRRVEQEVLKEWLDKRSAVEQYFKSMNSQSKASTKP